jgi:hypothetical protein
VAAGRDHGQLAEHVELLAQPPDAGDVHAGEHHDVGRAVERGQRLLRQPGRGVDDDVAELPRQRGEQAGDVLTGDGVAGGRRLRAADGVQAAGVLGEEGLEDHRVLARRPPDGVGQRVLGRQPQRRGAVAELHVEVDEHGRLRRGRGQPDGQVGRHRRLADPALGRGDGDDAAGVALGLRRRAEHAPPSGGRLRGLFHGGPDLRDVAGRVEQVADAGPHGGLPHLRRGLGHEDDGDAGALHVQPRGQVQDLGCGGVRADEQHLGQLAVDELLEQAGRIARQPPRGQDGDVTVGGLLDPEDQFLVGSGQNDAAHRDAPR